MQYLIAFLSIFFFILDYNLRCSTRNIDPFIAMDDLDGIVSRNRVSIEVIT